MADIADRFYLGLLVLRCQAGDRAAFAELVRHYHPRLRYFLQKTLGEAQAADDLLQDVWLDVFRGVARLAAPGAFPAWLYQIARRRAFRHLRTRRQPVYPLDGIDVPAEDGDGPDFTAEDAERVHTALDLLPDHHREVLLLRFIEEMSYEDIARVVGCPVGTVRSRIHHAKRGLRDALERRTPHE